MFIGYHALQLVIDALVIPHKKRQKLLQRPHRRAGRQSDRFNALAFEIGHQTEQLTLKMLKRRRPIKMWPKPLNQRAQRRLQ